MALIDCPYCHGDKKSRYVKMDDGSPVCCEWCEGIGKVGAITTEEIMTRRFDIFERNQQKGD